MRRLAILSLLFVAAILSCGKDVTGPLGAAARYARGLAFDPIFPPAFQAVGGSSSGVVQFTRVHVVLDHSDGTVALDTTIDFPSGSDSLTVDLTVKLLDNAPSTGEPMSLNLGYLNAAGDTVFKGGPVSVTAAPPAVPGQPNPPVKVPVAYTGPGASAVSVAISPRTQTITAGSPFSFTAIAKDGSGTAVAAPIIWNSLDPSIATIASAAAGSGSAGSTRGTAHIIAQLFSGAADTVLVNVLLPASQIIAQSGGAQSGIVGTNLTNPLIVKVAAVDGIGVAGATVNFAVASGGGSVGTATAVSDINGLAQTTFKLGTGTGVQSVTATSGSLTNSPLTFTDTAKAATATKLVVTTQPVNGVAGIALTAVVITAQDNNGNVATGFTSPVTVAFGTNTPSATLSGTTTVNAVAGVATFSTLAVNKNGSAYTLVASSTGVTSATTNAFDISVGAANKLVFTVQPAGAIANVGIAPAIVVNAQDSQGNLTPAFTGAVTLAFATNPTSATLGGTATVTAVAGVATFSGISVSTSGSGYALSASATGLTSATSSLFNIGGGVASAIVLASGGGQIAAPSSALALPVVIQVNDAGANPVPGTTVTFAVLTGGGSVGTASAVSNASGQVQTTWTLGALLGAQTISATSVGLTGSPLTITATAGFAAATQLKFTVQPTNAVAAVSIAPSIVVTAKDGLGNLAGSFVGNVTLTIAANPGGSTLSGTTTVAAVAGVATFNNISLNKASAGYTLQAASGVLTPDVSTPVFAISAGPAANVAVSAGQAQSGAVGSVLPTPLAVLVTDANANPVAGRTINWAIVTGAGSVSVASSVSNAAGVATVVWTLGPGAGPQSVSATSVGLVGSPLTFTANASVALANKTWTGAVDNQWSNAANWSPAGVPAATDSVVIPISPNNPALGAIATVANIYINAGATLTLTSGAAALNDNGTLDATGGILGTGSVVVNGLVPRNIKGTITATTLTMFGAYTQTGTLVVIGSVVINSGGSLIMNGNTTTVSGNFSVAATGTLTMINAADVLSVTGAVSFGGASETGLLTNGLITLGGNFFQTNTATSFVASGSQQVVFAGAAAQSINMANPGPSTFNKLTSGNSIGVTLLTNVVTASDLTTVGPITGAFGLTIGGQLTDLTGGVAVGAISFSGNPNPVSASTSTINTGVTFNGASTLLGNLTVNGGVNVNSAAGSLTIGAHVLTVNGTFGTANSGTLVMNVPGAGLTVSGNVTFSGGTSTLTQGLIKLSGNFTQNTTATAFTATPAHITRFLGTTPAITFANPATSNFGALQLQSSGATAFASSAQTTGDVWLKTGAVPSVTGAGQTVSIGGGLYDTTGGRWQVTNTVMFANNPAMPKTLATNLTFSGIVSLTDSLKLIGGANTLTVNAGSLTLAGHKVVVPGAFATSGIGVLIMQNAADSLIVHGNANFSGGSTVGLLNNGYLEVDGSNFFQGTNVTAFSADAPHITWFWGNLAQTIAFSNPGTVGASHFGNIYLQDTATVLNSNIFLNGKLETGGQSFFHVRAASDQLITSDGSDMRNVVFDNVRWKLSGTNGNGHFPSLDNVTFQNISATTLPQFDFEYSVTTNLNLPGFNFLTTPTGGGVYIKVVGPDTLTMSSITPASNGGFVSVFAGGAINGWSNTDTWLGSVSTAWATAANWSGGVPTAASDVVINSGSFQPSTGAAITVHSMSVITGAVVSVTGGALTVSGLIDVGALAQISIAGAFGIVANGDVVTDTTGTTGITSCAGGSSINLQAGSHNITGKFCNLSLFGTATATGPIQVVGTGLAGSLLPGAGGNLIFNGHRVDTRTYFATGGSGLITMTNALDTLYLHSGSTATPEFSGGSETGLMTAGAIIDRAAIVHVTGTGLDASVSQSFIVDTAFFQTLSWTSPVPGHGFNNVTMKGTAPRQFSGESWVTGTLLFDVSMTSGGLTSSTSLHLNTLVDNSLINGGGFQGSTALHMTGTTPFNRDTLIVNTLYFDHGQTFSLARNLVTNYMVVDSNSTLVLNGHRVDTQGNYFYTQNGGMLNMTTANDSLTASEFFFNGGATAGLLTKGGIMVAGGAGAFYQGYDAAHTLVPSASATSFAATGTRVWLNPSFQTTVAFANPGTGAGGSHFGFVQALSANPVVLRSDVFVDSLLLGNVFNQVWQSDSSAQNIVRTITTTGFNNSTQIMLLPAVKLVLNDGVAASNVQDLTFTNFPTITSGALLTLNRSASVPTVDNLGYVGTSFSGTGNFAFNAGPLSFTLGSSIAPVAGCNSMTLLTGTGCH
jgi:hypothetical protein